MCLSNKISAPNGVAESDCNRCPFVDHEPVGSVKTTKKVQLCVFYVDGESVRGVEAPDSVRDWRRCGMGHGVVCPCLLKCGPTCPDYQPNS